MSVQLWHKGSFPYISPSVYFAKYRILVNTSRGDKGCFRCLHISMRQSNPVWLYACVHTMFVHVYISIWESPHETTDCSVDIVRWESGICFEQDRIWPSGRTKPTAQRLSTWLACWSEQICLDTHTIHLKYTSHNLHNCKLMTFTLYPLQQV